MQRVIQFVPSEYVKGGQVATHKFHTLEAEVDGVVQGLTHSLTSPYVPVGQTPIQ